MVRLKAIVAAIKRIPAIYPARLNAAVRHSRIIRINFIAYPISKLACEYVPTETTAIYSMDSALNHPELTAYSPTTIPATTLSGVESRVGVLTAASFNPSMESYSSNSWKTTGTVISSDTVINIIHSGSHCGLSISNSHVGVRSIVTSVSRNLEILKYVPMTGAKL